MEGLESRKKSLPPAISILTKYIRGESFEPVSFDRVIPVLALSNFRFAFDLRKLDIRRGTEGKAVSMTVVLTIPNAHLGFAIHRNPRGLRRAVPRDPRGFSTQPDKSTLVIPAAD